MAQSRWVLPAPELPMAMRLAPVSTQSPAASASMRARGTAGSALKSKVARVLPPGRRDLDEMALDAPGLALGQFDLGQGCEEARGGPAFGVGALGERRASGDGSWAGAVRSAWRAARGRRRRGRSCADLQQGVEACQVGQRHGHIGRERPASRFEAFGKLAGIGKAPLLRDRRRSVRRVRPRSLRHGQARAARPYAGRRPSGARPRTARPRLRHTRSGERARRGRPIRRVPAVCGAGRGSRGDSRCDGRACRHRAGAGGDG